MGRVVVAGMCAPSVAFYGPECVLTTTSLSLSKWSLAVLADLDFHVPAPQLKEQGLDRLDKIIGTKLANQALSQLLSITVASLQCVLR